MAFLWGKKSKRNPPDTAVGLGPDYHAPVITSPADTYAPGINVPVPDLPVTTQWNVYTNPPHQWEDGWKADPERINRSKSQEHFGGQEYSTEGRKVIRPDESYWNPPSNPRRVEHPTPDYFRRTPFQLEPRLSGDHASAATNLRSYDIYGQGATYVPRINTYRATPAPMDINTVDIGTGPQNPPFVEYNSAVAGTRPRNFRLGG